MPDSKIYLLDAPKPVRGSFKITVRDRSGRVLYMDEDHNMIVNAAKIAMALLVSDPTSDSKVITTFGVGTGTNTPIPTDENLTNVYRNALVSHEYPEPGVVKFLWSLAYGEANGMAISEFGLFCEDGTLFARKSRAAINKDEDLAFDGEWSIIF